MTRRWYGPCIATMSLLCLVACSPAVAQVAQDHPAAGRAVARTSAETIPPGTALADLLYHPPAPDGGLVHAPVVDARLRLVVSTLNALPALTQRSRPCSPVGHETAQVTVDEGPARLQFRASLGTCGVVDVTFAGVAQPTLAMTDALRSALRAAAAAWPPAPPVGALEAALRPTAHSPGAARREAAAAMRLVHLPQALQDSPAAAVPPDDVFTLGTPSVVEQQSSWTVATAPADLLSYEAAHAPPGFAATESWSGNGSSTQGFTAAVNPYVVLRVTVSGKGAGSQVLVNAQVFWTPPEPPAEVIAAGVSSATLHYTAANRTNGKSGPTTSITLHGAALARVVHAVNALQTNTIDVLSSCAAGSGELATLRVHNRGHLVVFAIDFSGCSLVHVTSGKKIEPVLRTSESLERVIRALVR
jgi:hypothetical protein